MKKSFKKAIKKVELPIIEMNLYGKNYNFLVDTGSNHNYIVSQACADFEDKVTLVGGSSCTGIGANKILMKVIAVEYFIGRKKIMDKFNIMENTDCFNQIEQETGYRISGILGTTFLSFGQFTIDYGQMCITSHISKK